MRLQSLVLAVVRGGYEVAAGVRLMFVEGRPPKRRSWRFTSDERPVRFMLPQRAEFHSSVHAPVVDDDGRPGWNSIGR